MLRPERTVPVPRPRPAQLSLRRTEILRRLPLANGATARCWADPALPETPSTQAAPDAPRPVGKRLTGTDSALVQPGSATPTSVRNERYQRTRLAKRREKRADRSSAGAFKTGVAPWTPHTAERNGPKSLTWAQVEQGGFTSGRRRVQGPRKALRCSTFATANIEQRPYARIADIEVQPCPSLISRGDADDPARDRDGTI